MASYAAVLSLQNLLNTIKTHPNPPISLHNYHYQALDENTSFFLHFLELYAHRDDYPTTDGLDGRIKNAAHAAEDVIETYIVDQIEGSVLGVENNIDRGQRFYQDLQKVVEDVDIIKQQVTEIKEKLGDDLSTPVSSGISLSSSSFHRKKDIMVGFDDLLEDIFHKLTGYPQSSLQIIPVVGMGGIGKTTLAINAYQHPLVACHFDVCVWVTVSQTCDPREILIDILFQRKLGSKEALRIMSKEELGEMIHKDLFGRRYLVVMDDMWSTEAWDQINRFFPNNNNGSRIIVTTRISNVASQLSSSSGIRVSLLDEDESWNLLQKVVFQEDVCPVELEELGKTIARTCNGLPLSIVVVGGFLAKSERSTQHWEYVARNLSSIVNLEDNERCIKILQMSYRQLPIHLKSLFMYLGVIYQEDGFIRVSHVAKLLVAEGILKPVVGKTMEEIARVYIDDLVDRNLLLVDAWSPSSTRNIKFCRLHDLLTDLCIRESQKENFFHVIEGYNLDIQGGINAQRRIIVRRLLEKGSFSTQPQLVPQQYASLVRSLRWEPENCYPFFTFRLLRSLNAEHTQFKEVADDFRASLRLYNSRFLYFGTLCRYNPPTLCSHFWNLQTLIINGISDVPIKGLDEIWKMPQLRHVDVYNLKFEHPRHNLVLEKLQTLSFVTEFVCSEEVVERIPNVRKLKIGYVWEGPLNSCELNNLELLHKLEHLQFSGSGRVQSDLLHKYVIFPRSLKKLSLTGRIFSWEDVSPMSGSLPCLEALKLQDILGTEWISVGEQFSSLKFLRILYCNLEFWRVESGQFPHLECLSLHSLERLVEIPGVIGEIPTLGLIRVEHCGDSVMFSAKTLIEEQEEFGDSSLQVHITLSTTNQQLESLRRKSFRVRVVEFDPIAAAAKLIGMDTEEGNTPSH